MSVFSEFDGGVKEISKTMLLEFFVAVFNHFCSYIVLIQSSNSWKSNPKENFAILLKITKVITKTNEDVNPFKCLSTPNRTKQKMCILFKKNTFHTALFHTSQNAANY